ncbi:MAG: ABC transporter ATP-binding protein/permease [Hyphomicrobiaceae bacterium]
MNARADHLSVARGLLPYIWPAARPDLRRQVAFGAVVLVLAKIITVLVPLAYKAAVDWLTAAGPQSGHEIASGTTLALVPAMLVLAYGVGRVLMMGLQQLRDVLFTRVSLHAMREITTEAFTHLHRLSLRFHLERRTGALSRVMERGTAAIETIIRMGIMNSVPTALELLLVCGMLVWYFGIEFVVVVLLTIAAYMWFTVKASDWRIGIRREMNESDRDANAKAVDSLLNFETVKYFGNEDMESRRYDGSMARFERATVKTYYSLAVLNFGQALIFTIGLTICMLLSAEGVMRGTQTVGDFVMVNAMLIQLYLPLNFMGMVYREIKQGLVDLETMFALIAENPEIVDRPGAPDLEAREGAIRFENVVFGYEPARTILKGISFEVPAGRMVAIVGPSGAGKSTLSRILFRFYDVSGGRVLIDGQDIRDVTQRSLRAAIGVVPQDTVLFNDTVFYNIAYGRPSASEEEVKEAARQARIHDFVMQMPNGYDTMVGERGLKLSGGEKQRVAIARTILKAPPILVLDEATSALDSHTEKEIQDELERVARDRTTLVIAHRLSTIVHADNIIVLRDGEIAEEGTHAELMVKGGLYASMWNRQREAEQARERLALALEEEAGILGTGAPNRKTLLGADG